MPRATLFIDNGGYTIKALYLPPATTNTAEVGADTTPSSAPRLQQPRVLCMPNCVGAAPHAGTGLLGEQLTHLPHYHGVMLRRPVDRGYIVDGALQARIWEHVLQHFAIEDEASIDVWLTVPHGTPKPVAQLLWLLCTRSFRFASVTFVSSSFLALIADGFGRDAEQQEEGAVCMSTSDTHAAMAGGSDASSTVAQRRKRARRDCDRKDDDCVESSSSSSDSRRGGTAVVVDVGFSGTSIVPYVDHLPVLSSAVRIDIGGKLLTNRLKEVLSFSQVNVMEDTWLINHVREVCCVVALNPWQSLRGYAALWKGKSRLEVDASVPSTYSTQQHQRRRNPGLIVNDGDNDAVKNVSPAAPGANSAKSEDDGVATVAAGESPMRFYLPTIPALFPLGVREAELPSRLPRSSAVDSNALQHLLLCHERFLIPELLFTPADVGVDQQGLTQAITEGIFQRGLLRHATALLRPQLLRRVCVYGGTADTPLLRVRLAHEIAAASPADEKNDETNAVPSGSVVPPSSPPLPNVVRVAAQQCAAASPLSLQPLLGAYHLLRTPAEYTTISAPRQEMMRLRALVHHRSAVELLQPTSGKVTVEHFQAALRQML